MTVYLTHKDQSIVLVTEPVTHRLVWCSPWEIADELVTAGILRREHCEFFYV